MPSAACTRVAVAGNVLVGRRGGEHDEIEIAALQAGLVERALRRP